MKTASFNSIIKQNMAKSKDMGKARKAKNLSKRDSRDKENQPKT